MKRGVLSGKGIFFLVFLLLGCGREPDLDTYYPLTEGMRRTTQTKITETAGPDKMEERESRASLIYLPAQELQGKTVFPMKSNQIGGPKDITIVIYLGKDQEGIFLVGHQITLDKKIREPKFMERKDYLLKKPLKVGNEWSAESGSYLKPPEKVQLKVVIESLDETISVPAGTFKKCLKLTKKGDKTLKNGAAVKIEQTLWYAPGAGFVKFIDLQTMTEDGKTKIRKSVTQLESIEK
ncbi:MAG: hypothetical protein FJ128_02135 [Deltaproteobacteria bacterium]|nr:hypothetical protein [Deltaproteobacteria bacterium]